MTNRAARRRGVKEAAKRPVGTPIGPIAQSSITKAPQPVPGAAPGVQGISVDIDFLLKRIGALDVEVEVWKSRANAVERQLTQLLSTIEGETEEPESGVDAEPVALHPPLPGAELSQADLDAVRKQMDEGSKPEVPADIAEKAAWVDDGGTDELAEAPVTLSPEEAHTHTEEEPNPGGLEATPGQVQELEE